MLQPPTLTMTQGYLMVWTESLMPLDASIFSPAVLLGLAIVIGLCLLGLSFWIGLMLGRRAVRTEEVVDASEKKRMLELIHEIGLWTNEYSGKVSQYQSKLDELNREVALQSENAENDHASQVAESPDVKQTSHRIVSLLQQFMQDNGKLQQRLDNAELQLEQKTRQIERYLNQARTDDLTSLLNRRAFDQYLDELFDNHRRGGRSFVIALIDIDHFKRVNDSHGHQTGDGALRDIAQRLQGSLAEALMVARFGGEEFAVILDGPLLYSANLLDQVRREIDSKGQHVDDLHLHSTISVGLSEPHDDASAASLLRRADEALYAAKNFGRNRVYYHDGLEPTLVGAPETAQP